MKKFLCTSLSAMILCTFTTGCGDKESESEGGGNMVGTADDYVNIGLDDMPYGAYVTELSPNADENLTYKICFDSRYFERTNEQDYTEMYRLHDFILALNTNDHELMESLFYPDYLEYICKKDGLDDVNAYLDNLYNYIVSLLGEEFEMNYINVSNCYSAEDETAVSYLQTTDSEIIGFDSSLSDKVTSKKVVEIGGDTYFKSDENSGSIINYMDPFVLSLYEIDGETYIFM